MSNQKRHEYMKNLDKCYNVVRQSSAKRMSAVEIAKQLGIHKTTVYGYLNSLELKGKVENEHGTWRARTGEQSTALEKEIIIELPIPKNQWLQIGLLEVLEKDVEEAKLRKTARMYRILLEKLKETRTIKIKGKNVDSLDLEKVQNLILQANQKGSKINLKGFLKSLKRSRATNNT